VSGTWNGSSWVFNAPVKKNIGERYAYEYVFPGAYGNAAEFVDISIRDVTRSVAGLPLLTKDYAWDGIRQHKSGTTNTTNWSIYDIIPLRTPPSSTTTVAAFMYFSDVFADSKGRLFTMTHVSDPEGPSGLHFIVLDNSNTVLHSSILPSIGGNYKIFEDGKNRIWIMNFANTSSGASVKLWRMNDNYTLGTMYDLSSKFAGFPYEGMGRIAVPRGGSTIGNAISGSFPNGTSLTSWRIRLPD
jgi:hypothetical protein